MEKFIKLLRTIRVLDHNNEISLSNLAVVATLVNLMACQEASLEAVGSFLASLIAYNVKRFAKPAETSNATEMESLKEALHKLETSVTAIKMSNSPTRRR